MSDLTVTIPDDEIDAAVHAAPRGWGRVDLKWSREADRWMLHIRHRTLLGMLMAAKFTQQEEPMRSPFYWLKRRNRENYAASVAVASERLGVEKARNQLHHKGLLSPAVAAALDEIKPSDALLRSHGL